MEIDGHDGMRGPLLRHPIFEGSAVSDQQLLHLLSERKASTQSLWQPASSQGKQVIIKDVPSNQDLHPIIILTVLGVDLSMRSQLDLCYYFFSYTKYPKNVAIFSRDRQTKDGLHFWLQGGGKMSVIDDKTEESCQDAVIGWKKKFTFAEKRNRKRLPIMVGSNAYSFRLEELVLAEDEDKEKRTSLAGKTPQSFLCVNRLYPIAHSSPQTLSGVSDQESPPTLLMDSQQSLTFEEAVDQGREFLKSTISYNPQEWKSPELICVPGLEERCDLQLMSPFNKD